jgi:hypothetical protein
MKLIRISLVTCRATWITNAGFGALLTTNGGREVKLR